MRTGNKFRKVLEWCFWAAILLVFAFAGFNRLINSLVHSKKEQIVPNMIGKSIVDALNITSQINIYIKKVGDEFNAEIPAGMIISQTPPAGNVVREGGVVKVVVSAGGEVVYVPNLAGETVRSAQLILRKSGLDLGEQSVKYSMTVERGKVISHDPQPNMPFHKNGLVNIVVSHGQPPEGTYLMPDFTGKNIIEAQDWARQNGIAVKNVTNVSDSKYPSNSVIKQSPESDMPVDKNSGLEFWVAVVPQ
jgi:serine/threonine-protein kinase